MWGRRGMGMAMLSMMEVKFRIVRWRVAGGLTTGNPLTSPLG